MIPRTVVVSLRDLLQRPCRLRIGADPLGEGQPAPLDRRLDARGVAGDEPERRNGDRVDAVLVSELDHLPEFRLCGFPADREPASRRASNAQISMYLCPNSVACSALAKACSYADSKRPPMYALAHND